MIYIAEDNDIDDILKLTKACAKHMISKGIYQWNEFYPNKQAFENDLNRNELYVLKQENTLKGCITISSFMDNEYKTVKWLTPTTKHIYIHRLAIHPEFQGKGYAQQLMDCAETYAKENKFASIRLDTFSQNKRNQMFYKIRGYKRLDNVYFPKQSKYPFYCYELVL